MRPFPIVLLFKSNLNNSLDNLRARVVPKNPRNHRRISRNPLTREILLFVTRSAQSYFKPLLGPLDGNAHDWGKNEIRRKVSPSLSRNFYIEKKGVQETYKVASMPIDVIRTLISYNIMKGIPAQGILASCLVFESIHLKRSVARNSPGRPFHSAQFTKILLNFRWFVQRNNWWNG